jgi:hypothetical protein
VVSLRLSLRLNENYCNRVGGIIHRPAAALSLYLCITCKYTWQIAAEGRPAVFDRWSTALGLRRDGSRSLGSPLVGVGPFRLPSGPVAAWIGPSVMEDVSSAFAYPATVGGAQAVRSSSYPEALSVSVSTRGNEGQASMMSAFSPSALATSAMSASCPARYSSQT